MKVYIPVKQKSNVSGYWVDGEKLYKDNIRIVNIESYKDMEIIFKKLFGNGELCIFTTQKQGLFGKDIAKLYYKNGKKEQLTNKKVYYIRKSEQLKNKIVSFCKNFGGCTIYNNGKKTVKIEIWS